MSVEHCPASKQRLRLFLIDGHVVYRHGLRDVFDVDGGFDVVGEAGAWAGSLDRVIESQAEVVVIDPRLPDVDGTEACRSIIAGSSARCVVLTSYPPTKSDLVRVVESGVSAYLVKGVGLDELLSSIRSVASGRDLLASPGPGSR